MSETKILRKLVIPAGGADRGLFMYGGFFVCMYVAYLIVDSSKDKFALIPVFIAGPFIYVLLWTKIFSKIYISFKRTEMKERVEKAFREYSDNILAMFSDLCGVPKRNNRISGTGMAWDGKNLLIMDTGELGIIPWDQIRSWSSVIAGRTTFHNFGWILDSTRPATNMANAEAGATQLRASGIFVRVVDKQKPIWQMMTTDENVLAQWDEILTQINEEVKQTSQPLVTVNQA